MPYTYMYGVSGISTTSNNRALCTGLTARYLSPGSLGILHRFTIIPYYNNCDVNDYMTNFQGGCGGGLYKQP